MPYKNDSFLNTQKNWNPQSYREVSYTGTALFSGTQSLKLRCERFYKTVLWHSERLWPKCPSLFRPNAGGNWVLTEEKESLACREGSLWVLGPRGSSHRLSVAPAPREAEFSGWVSNWPGPVASASLYGWAPQGGRVQAATEAAERRGAEQLPARHWVLCPQA